MSLNLGVLVSGSGTNLAAIIDAIRTGVLAANLRVVVSNRVDAYGLERARHASIPTVALSHRDYPSREAFDDELVRVLTEHEVNFVVLAGFMRILTPRFLDPFAGRVLNIHPSLLPAFPGVDAQKQAFDYGVKIAGCTVHFVDRGVDSGPIVLQRAVPVLAGDTAESLRLRILEQEHSALVEALVLLQKGSLRVLRSESGRDIVEYAATSESASRS